MLKHQFFYLLFTALFFTACAKRGTVSGGPKDTIPPTITSSTPKNMTTNFSGSEIHINFDEYIKIKDINKQLIISPPMKNTPSITPTGSASKFINIKIKDTLQPNTTYSFNFGQSITDNNEGNPYSQFKFVFSTGSYIDSLSLKGKISDAYERETDNFVTVMLYEAETFTDSTVYNERPRYVTNTLDSLVYYSLENLKEGKYRIFALKDANNNYMYDPKADKIAFLNEVISVPNDTVYELQLFAEKKAFKYLKPLQASSNRLYAPFEGDHRDMKVEVRNGTGNEVIKTLTTKVKDKDSLQVWLPRGLTADSLKVSVANRDSIKDFSVKFKEMKAADSLSVEAIQKGGLNFREKFRIRATTPIMAVDSTKITFINKDSIAVPFTTRYYDMEQELEFDFAKGEEEKYSIMLFPGALTDFYGQENDTLNFRLSTRAYTDYGNLRISLANVKRFPLILDVIDSKDEVMATFYSKGETTVNFDSILPDKYRLRIIYDDNGNKEWDTGSFMEKRQPEEVLYHPAVIDVRGNWDVDETINLGG